MNENELVEAPVLAGNLVLFPHMHCCVELRTPRSLSAIDAARTTGRLVAVVANRFASPHDQWGHLHDVGTLARVSERPFAGGQRTAELEGIARVRIMTWDRLSPHRVVCCRPLPVEPPGPDEHRLALDIRAVTHRIHSHFSRCLHARAAVYRLDHSDSPESVLGAVGGLLLHLQVFELQQLLELEPLSARLEAVLFELHERLVRAVGTTSARS